MPLTPKYLIIHCAATPPSVNADAAWIDRVHRQKGWKKIGYHEVITRTGERQNAEGGFKARKLTEPGAHVGGCGRGWNSKTIGICLIGGVDGDGKAENNFTEAQMDALVEAVKEYQTRFDIPDDKVMGHRDLIAMTGKGGPKDCPSFDVRAFLFGTEPPVEVNEPEAPKGEAPETHIVVHGDTLWEIAQTHGLSVEQLRDLNRIPEGSDLIRIGQQLRLR